MIEHDTIFYVNNISDIGGVETYLWEMVKRYKDFDIAVVYKKADDKQLERLSKHCYTYCHTDQKIICKVAIINYDTSIIDFINKEARIYQVIHADYRHPVYENAIPHDDRIYQYIGVTKEIRDSFKELTGFDNVTYCYNPLEIDKKSKPLILLSATRLSGIKGKDRILKLIDELDKQKVNYIWFILTNDTNVIDHPRVIVMPPTLDTDKWFNIADYLIQLSDTEACSYAINEALYRQIPVITTPLPYLAEIGVKDGENAYILEFDCSNIKSVVKRIKNIPKVVFEPLSCDLYDKIVVCSQSKFKLDSKTIVTVNVTRNFRDAKCDDKLREVGTKFQCNMVRAKELIGYGDVEIIN